MRWIVSILLVSLLASCGTSFDAAKEEKAVLTVMAKQEKAWNEGDIEAFMEGYWKSDSLVFIGSSVQYGWQQTLDNYTKSYPTKDNMGILTFDIMQVEVVSSTDAHVIGKWHLAREKMVDRAGHYTLFWKKIDGRWVIVADHSS